MKLKGTNSLGMPVSRTHRQPLTYPTHLGCPIAALSRPL
jgi:hypothetical protein